MKGTQRQRLRVTATTLIAVTSTCLLAACDPTEETTDPTTQTTTPVTLTGVPSAGRGLGQQATEAAVAALEDYLTVRGDLINHPDEPLERLDDHITGFATTEIREEITELRDNDLRLHGHRTVAQASPEEVIAPGDEDGNPAPGTAEVRLSVCENVAAEFIVDHEGYDVTPLDRPDQLQRFYTLENEAWPDPAGWMITEYLAFGDEECLGY